MLYSHFCHQILANPPKTKRLVLALSGGLDSRVMLDLLARFISDHRDYCAHAVYVHHGLSTNADTWAQQCVTWAASCGVSCNIERVQCELGRGISVEQAAREVRYQALAKHIQCGDTLLTAQHADDQIETVLLALKRGSGPAGLAAMPMLTTFATGQHLRPLLTISRAEIEAYGAQYKLQWVEDESNQDQRYDRNFIRHQITPLLNDRWPGIRKAVTRSAHLCGEQEGLLEELLSFHLHQAVQTDGSLLITDNISARLGMALIRQWLKQQAVIMPSLAQLEQIWFNLVQAKNDANPQVCWQQYQLRRYQQQLHLLQQWPDISHWQQTLITNQACQLPQDLGQVCLKETPSATLRPPKADELVSVRFDYSGPEIKPQGRSGKRKFKKLLQEYQVPSWLRRRTPMLFYGEQLVAIAGVFVVEEFVVPAATTTAVQFEWQRS
ncbi:tRNA lysidine(34) synthetase TilS [Photobacterium kishitanii]|uniref:tRNA(Ile)-lysidine synthase n=1 Tax=Photobacterium kishitanii TaxID=318456 RepID=A0A2T3KE68_9GAMM|nr:tRNA lysidine(34) synthetase TilS [Photobacterium kishitanii]PSU89322.1 tRNA lysidine(34) synthetase TilS [Photobacterium kishitanii]PSU95166.1 tRNA lysidine(34) synthetase TilS [Photobacterium kishitanii]